MAQAQNEGITLFELIKNIGPTVVSAVALLISLLSYRIAKRKDKRDVANTKPLITATVYPLKDQPGWFHIYWSFENRSAHGYRCNYIKICRPLFCRGITRQQAYHPGEKDKPWNPTGAFKNPLPLLEAVRKMPMNFTIAKAGASGHFTSPNHWESIYVSVSPWGFSRRLSMRVSLSSIDSEERESLFTVKRTVPAVPKTNSD